MKQPITAFIGLFEEKLKRLKDDLKKELERAKSDRRKEVMKRLVSEAKGLQKTIKSVKPDETKRDRNVCWVCGGELIWGGDHDKRKPCREKSFYERIVLPYGVLYKSMQTCCNKIARNSQR